MKLLPIQSGVMTKEFSDGTVIKVGVAEGVTESEVTFDIRLGPIYADFLPEYDGLSVLFDRALYIDIDDGGGGSTNTFYDDETFFVSMVGDFSDNYNRGEFDKDFEISIKNSAQFDSNERIGLYYLDVKERKWKKVKEVEYDSENGEVYFKTKYSIFGLFSLPESVFEINTVSLNKLNKILEIEKLEAGIIKGEVRVSEPYVEQGVGLSEGEVGRVVVDERVEVDLVEETSDEDDGVRQEVVSDVNDELIKESDYKEMSDAELQDGGVVEMDAVLMGLFRYFNIELPVLVIRFVLLVWIILLIVLLFDLIDYLKRKNRS